ncbi:hypothetical protein CAMRE0001_2643 [Campylobacter rectus RM3267]|uniref:Uncharacterized protein n=1 Tax=Campylobacter rectus RM3267 TaxID=553218 RepID=B9D523_CAMRE|nr:hypothetical protein CAMRE0001_2643 [Campylobacter rectus RM3267]
MSEIKRLINLNFLSNFINYRRKAQGQNARSINLKRLKFKFG